MNRFNKIARKIMASELVAVDFFTKEAMDAYLKEHPNADRSNHHLIRRHDEDSYKQEYIKKAPPKGKIEKFTDTVKEKVFRKKPNLDEEYDRALDRTVKEEERKNPSPELDLRDTQGIFGVSSEY